MYRVLLVDDEPMALEMLKYVVDWEKNGCLICGTCGNGEEAVKAISKFQPDIIITDIRMPVMDGLDLIRYAKENGKENIKFIVVSGYGEFEYARRAMQYGVRFYLQKPIMQDEIEEIIVEVKKQLSKCRKKQESVEMDERAILNCVLGNVILGNYRKEVLEHLSSFMDEEMIHMGWNCSVIELEAPYELDINEDFKNVRFQVVQAIEEIVKSNRGVFANYGGSNTLNILISLKDDEVHSSKVNHITESIYESLNSIISSRFTIAVGENVEGIMNIKHSHTTAVEALTYRFYKGINSLIFYNEIKETPFKFEFNELFMSNKVFEAVEEFNNNKIKNTIETTFEFFENHRIDPEIVIMFISNMICKINNLTYKSGDKNNECIDKHSIRELEKHKNTMEELKKFFENLCMESCEYFKKVRNNNPEDNISKIEAFIKENYKRNITIRELAENVYMHPAYLGQLFSRKFGMSFNEYIHELRVEEAKRLMNITSLKNHEIAEELGYSSYNSFLQQFQKCTGMKPSEYKNKSIVNYQ